MKITPTKINRLLITFESIKRYFLCLVILGSNFLVADEIYLAVASNFRHPMEKIVKFFQAKTGHRVRSVFGSSSKHYAQIRNGAPFDVFFSADKKRPRLLVEDQIALPKTRFTYAIGRLVLWYPESDRIMNEENILKKKLPYLAIANPELAPYGKAAKEVLIRLGVWDAWKESLVQGVNIDQTYQFVHSGNANWGLVSYAQIRASFNPSVSNRRQVWLVPRKFYHPIEQQAVLIKDRKAAHSLLAFIRSQAGVKIIEDYGYFVPHVER